MSRSPIPVGVGRPDRVRVGREVRWWFADTGFAPAGLSFMQASDVLPDGAVIREVHFEFGKKHPQVQNNMHLHTSLVTAESPTHAEVVAGELYMPWEHAGVCGFWVPIVENAQIDYACHYTVRGSNLRVGISSERAIGSPEVFRFGVAWELP